MIDYVYSYDCLRQNILQYFGQVDTKHKCDNCLNCQINETAEEKDITKEAISIFKCIKNINQKFGIAMVSEIVKGSRNKKILSYGFDQLSEYSSLSDYTLEQIKKIISVLISQGYLVLSQGEYPLLFLKQKTGQVVNNVEKVSMKINRNEKVIKEYKKKDNILLEKLKQWRYDLAQQEKIPPYIILADSSLKELVTFLPTDLQSLVDIKGFGQYKVDTYGQQILEIINEYLDQNNIKGNYKSVKNKKEKKPTHLISYEMYQSGLDLEKIALKRNLKTRTIEDHIVKSSAEGEEVNWDDFIEYEDEKLILQAIDDIGAERLSPIKEVLPDRIDYFTIKAVICKNRFE